MRCAFRVRLRKACPNFTLPTSHFSLLIQITVYIVAAAIRPLNNAPGLFGLDLNSGWNWLAIKNG